MNDSEYQKLYELETTYWWHVGRRAIIATLLHDREGAEEKSPKEKSQTLYAVKSLTLGPPAPGGRNSDSFPSGPRESTDLKILDIGCGTGENINFLSRFGKVTGIDISERAIKFCKKRRLENVKIGKAEALPFKENGFDLVTMLDLLEHLKDDLLALREAFRVLKPRGRILITVPSYRFLWSGHDEALHHQRRYSKKELEEKVKKAGFKVKKLSFAITTFFPLILFFRLSQKLFIKSALPKTSYVILPDWLNSSFIGLLKLEAQLLRHINLPFGVSLVCVAEKKE